MPTERTSSRGRSASRRQLDPDLLDAIGEAVESTVGRMVRQAENRRDPRRRQEELFDRLEDFLDGFASAKREEGAPRGQRRSGQRDDDDQDDDDDEGPSLLQLLAGGGGGRRR